MSQYHGFKYHPKANDSQIPISKPGISHELQSQTSGCLLNICTEMFHKHLRLDVSKTELLISPANPHLPKPTPFIVFSLNSWQLLPSSCSGQNPYNDPWYLCLIIHIQSIGKSCQFYPQDNIYVILEMRVYVCVCLKT